MDRKRRRRSVFEEFSPASHQISSSKRACFTSTESADHDSAGSRLSGLCWHENRPPLANDGHRQRAVDHTQSLPFVSWTLDEQLARSPALRQLPVIPKPRHPGAAFSSASPLIPSASTALPLRNNSVLSLFSPFRLTPAAVPPTLPPPPPALFGLYHPAFWGALPYLIGRAMRGEKQVPEDPLSGCPAPSSDDRHPSSPCSPGLTESLPRSWDSQPVRRRACNPRSLSPDVGPSSLQDAASSGLEDMARMVSRLESVRPVARS